MTTTRNDPLRAIFDRAAVLPSAERPALLDALCGNDGRLREQVESLLRALEGGADFLENPTLGAGPIGGEGDARIGPYELLEQIGEGGMGVVYMAEQLRPVRRRVALKLIKPGLDTRQVIARFDAERQALAMMDHPNIARVLDGGATETGRPYFVMELVHGIPITDYCDQHQLTPRQRLTLFVQVCQAVQHAHTKGVIHRDLKPSNVLVMRGDDGQPVPKVIDFGIAKAIGGQRLTDRTLFTGFQQLVGTPMYMSPEQAQMSAAPDVDTRSDVYCLGVLLYELLTGTTPFDKRRLAQAAYDEACRIVREEEPPRPSTRLSTLAADTLGTVSASRHADPKRLSQTVRGELDWIVMKALEKDRGRRYETASAFAQDVERYLGDEPVEAGPPSRAYRLRKFARRNRAGIATAGTMALVLALATVVSTRQAIRATQADHETAQQRDQAEAQRQRADKEAAMARAVNQFFNDELLRQASPYNQVGYHEPPDRDLKVRDALDRAAARMRQRFRDRPLVEAAIHYSLGDAYGDLLETDKAEAHLQAALQLFRRELGEKADETLNTIGRLAALYRDVRKDDKAAALWQQELERRRKLFGDEAPQTLVAMDGLAGAYLAQDNMGDRALALRLNVLAICRRTVGDRAMTASALAAVGYTYRSLRRYDEAKKPLTEALDLDRQLYGEQSGQVFDVKAQLAAIYATQRDYPRAEPLLREALQGWRVLEGEQAPATLGSWEQLGNLYVAMHEYDRAAECLSNALAGRRRLSEDHSVTSATIGDLGSLCAWQGRYARAEPLLRQAADWCLAHPTAPLSARATDQYLACLSFCYRALGEPQKAAESEQRLRRWVGEQLEREFPTTLPADAGQAANRLFKRAPRYNQLGEFATTAAELPKAIRVRYSQNSLVLLACTQLFLQDGRGYLASVRLLHTPSETSRSGVSIIEGEACLLAPGAPEQLSLAAAWIDKAAALAAGPTSAPNALWFNSNNTLVWWSIAPPSEHQIRLARGMLEYRRGQFDSAARLLADCRDGIQRSHPLGSERFGRIGAWESAAEFYLAMAHAHLGHAPQAAQALASGRTHLDAEVPARSSADPQVGTPDWLIAHIAAREAAALIEPASPTTYPAASQTPEPP
jgi:eukaryotic-like serine/threonine-protein kinase